MIILYVGPEGQPRRTYRHLIQDGLSLSQAGVSQTLDVCR